MDYFKRKEIENKIKSIIEDLKDYDIVDHYIDANFQQFLRNGEYDDNSMDLHYHYTMIKKIENDKEFFNKLNFVLTRFVKC